MKISKSKQELARIISENGGWRDGAEFSVSSCNGTIVFSRSKPKYTSKYGWTSSGGFIGHRIELCSYLKNWHQTILSREEYFHLYPEPDADGWIEWKGGDASPVAKGVAVDVKMKNGTEHFGQLLSDACWHDSWGEASVIAYRLHKPEQVKPVGSAAIGVAESAPEAKLTIEQLAADYRNAKDYAESKQQEADSAKVDADAKLKALELACEEIGMKVSPITAKKEPELVITDYHQLHVGDILRCKSVPSGAKCRIGDEGSLKRTENSPLAGGVYVEVCGRDWFGVFGEHWEFIRRP